MMSWGWTGTLAGRQVVAEIHHNRVRQAGADDLDGMAGGGGQTAGNQQHLSEASLRGDGHDGVYFAGNDDRAVYGVEHLDNDLRILIEPAGVQPVGDPGLGLAHLQPTDIDAADKGQLGISALIQAHGCQVIGLQKNPHLDQVSWA